VSAAIILSGVTDMGWPTAWEGYVDSEREVMRLPGEEAATAWCVEKFGADGSGFLTASDLEFGEPDNALLADEQVGPAFMAALSEAFRQGIVGYAQDMVIQGRPWPFDPGTITVPVQVVHGEQDVVLPLAHSRHTTELIPGSTLRVLPGHGHLTTVSELPHLASALARATG
jgi:pimeloyl-ACP methyl ester carboxylesterase